MKHTVSRTRVVTFAVALASLSLAFRAHAEDLFANDFESGTVCPWDDAFPHVACWSNPAGGDWNVPSNWRDGVVPPSGSNVGVDLPVPPMTITMTTADAYVRQLTVFASLAISGRSLTVTGPGRVYGHVTASAASTLSVTGAGATLVVNDTPTDLPGVTLQASAGGSLTAPLVTNVAGGRLNVDGAGSALNLSSLTNIDNASLTATSGGHLSLPLITSMTCNATNKPCYSNYPFYSSGNGSLVNLPALTTFRASTGSYLEAYGYGGGTVKLPVLTTLNLTNGTLFHFAANGVGAEVGIDALASMPTAVSAIISNGGLVKAPSLTTLAGAVTMSGAGNDFTSALTTVSGTLTVAGATISLPSLTTVAGSSITVGAGGTLTLGGTPSAAGALLSINGGGSLIANGVTDLSGGRVSVDGATSSVSFTALTNIDNVSVLANNGGHVTLPAVTSMTCNVSNKPCYATNPFYAAGIGSQVSLPALTTFTATTGSYLEAYGYGGGTVKLPALTSVNLTNTLFHFNATGSGAEVDIDALATLPTAASVIIGSGGLVKAPSLTTLAGAVTMSGAGNGFTSALTTITGTLSVVGATISLPSLTSVAGSSISVGTGAALTLGGTPSAAGAILAINGGGSLIANGLTDLSGGRVTVDGATSSASLTALANIDNASITASGGGDVTLPAVTSMTCNASNKPCYANNPFYSWGAGSLVNMPALATFSASTGSYLEAYGYGGGIVKLPVLTAINLTNGTNFHVNATGVGAEVDIDALATLPTAVTVIIANGGMVKAPSLATLAGAVTMSGTGNGFTSALASVTGSLSVAGATISLPNPTTIAGSSITVGSGGTLTLGGAPSATDAILSINGGGSLTANGISNLSGGRVSVDGATSSVSLTGLTNIDNVSLAATTGGHVSLPAVTSMTCNATNKPCYSNNPINASGTGSQVTLSSLATFTVTTGSVLTVGATSGASVALAALSTIGTTNTDLTFSANGSGSQIDLSALHAGGYDAGHVTFNATNGGTILLPAPLTIASGDGAGTRNASSRVLAARVDLDGDGEPDAIQAQHAGNTLDVLATAGPAGAGAATSYRLHGAAASLALADWDGDGALDLAVAIAGAKSVAVLLGIGDGTFVPAPDVHLPFAPRSIAAHDANGDGIPDLVAVDDHVDDVVMLGRGDGGFAVPMR